MKTTVYLSEEAKRWVFQLASMTRQSISIVLDNLALESKRASTRKPAVRRKVNKIAAVELKKAA